MARFHFHVDDEQDVDGLDLHDHGRARTEAMRSVGQTLMDEASPAGRDDLHMNVTNAEGLTLYHLDVAITDSPAIKRKGPAQ